jgi:hypothetical protein
MIEWAEANIQLLKKSRCDNLLRQAIKILEGLIYLHSELIGIPTWPSVSQQNITLFLLKIYLSNNFMNTNDLIQYLDLPVEEIQLICARILSNKTSTNALNELINSLDLSDINMNETLQHDFLYETLIQFDQIIKIATIEIWQDYKQKTKQIETSNKLKAKMASLETSSASAATAQAISNATAKITNTQEQNLQTALRLSNLEKALKRQEQKTNEVVNNLQTKNKNTPFQKNYTGSRLKESTTSPFKQTPRKDQLNLTSQLIDLTTNNEEQEMENSYPDTQANYLHPHNKTPQKWHLNAREMQPQKGRKLQWKQSEIIKYNPNNPVAIATPAIHKHNSLRLGKTPNPAMAPSPNRYQINRNNITYQQLPFGTPNPNPFQSLPNPFTQQIFAQPQTTKKRNNTNSDSRHFPKQKRNRRNPDV